MQVLCGKPYHGWNDDGTVTCEHCGATLGNTFIVYTLDPSWTVGAVVTPWIVCEECHDEAEGQ